MPFHYYKLYKPYGYLSQFTPDHPGQKTLKDLYDFPTDVYSVGRLDKDSEGLLLLSNDKRFKTRMLDPELGHRRTYLLQVEGDPKPEDLIPIIEGMTIKINKRLYRTKPAQFKIRDNKPAVPERDPPVRFRKTVPDTWIELTLIEGKNRQVRRMMAQVGFPVLRLIRVRMDKYELGEMSPGEVNEFKVER